MLATRRVSPSSFPPSSQIFILAEFVHSDLVLVVGSAGDPVQQAAAHGRTASFAVTPPPPQHICKTNSWGKRDENLLVFREPRRRKGEKGKGKRSAHASFTVAGWERRSEWCVVADEAIIIPALPSKTDSGDKYGASVISVLRYSVILAFSIGIGFRLFACPPSSISRASYLRGKLRGHSIAVTAASSWRPSRRSNRVRSERANEMGRKLGTSA